MPPGRRGSAKFFRPGLERFEEKHLLNAGPANLKALSSALAHRSAHPQPAPAASFTLQRITNPTPVNAQLNPPFQQVFVQSAMPVTGGIYNVLFVSLRNRRRRRTIDASRGFSVGVTGGRQAFPILTGTETWKPGQVMVFYILTKKYYPPNPPVSAGFVFNFGGQGAGTAVPGPSGIFLRIRYNPATISNILNYIVAFGPGSKGHLLGLPDTAIWEFIPAKGAGRPRPARWSRANAASGASIAGRRSGFRRSPGPPGKPGIEDDSPRREQSG